MSAPAFVLPAALEAREPPEHRGIARDDVRMMVTYRGTGEIVHAAFRNLPEFFDPGDLLVVNNSATLPAAVPGRLADGTPIELRFAGAAPSMSRDQWWDRSRECGRACIATGAPTSEVCEGSS